MARNAKDETIKACK